MESPINGGKYLGFPVFFFTPKNMELLNGLSCRKFVAHGPARSGRVRAHRGRTPCHHQGQHLGSFAPNQQRKSQGGEKHVAGSPKDPDIP